MEHNHYGRWVDSEKPTIGVVTNHEPEFLIEDAMAGIDIDWVQYAADCESAGKDPADDDWEQGTTIIGYIESPMDPSLVMRSNPLAIGAGGKVFVPDLNAEYQAIVGETYTQVIHSRYVQRCPLCSPCFPGQADLDSEVPLSFAHDGFVAYTLPPDVWGSRKGWRRISQWCITRGEVQYA